MGEVGVNIDKGLYFASGDLSEILCAGPEFLVK